MQEIVPLGIESPKRPEEFILSLWWRRSFVLELQGVLGLVFEERNALLACNITKSHHRQRQENMTLSPEDIYEVSFEK